MGQEATPPRADRGTTDAQAEPDVLLDVPKLQVDEIDLEVEDLRARVSLRTEVLDVLRLNVGADVALGRVKLTIKGVEAEAHLKVRLDNVARIVERVLDTVDRNPEILTSLTRGVEDTLEGVGTGTEDALRAVGSGAGNAVEQVSDGAGDAVRHVGRGAGDATTALGTAGKTAAGVTGALSGLRERAKGALRDRSPGVGERLSGIFNRGRDGSRSHREAGGRARRRRGDGRDVPPDKRRSARQTRRDLPP
ncbi:hypothetical protein [Streptomyces coryli]|uniref:hypothetical protein n=1 Tax=Streptomyces coryli TaxID=1128680 RepID=UPI0019CFFD78|nr:hypothetical protein [Streptomyces coryli]